MAGRRDEESERDGAEREPADADEKQDGGERDEGDADEDGHPLGALALRDERLELGAALFVRRQVFETSRPPFARSTRAPRGSMAP